MKGVNLSGGRNSVLGLLEHYSEMDATSALDTKTENVVQKNIDRMMKSKTRITVAHRLNTIMDSDIIHMFENGQIVESGKYEDLISLKGGFFYLQQGIQKEQPQEIQ